MDLIEDIKIYLPQYLSEENLVSLRRELKRFGQGYDYGAYFTSKLREEPYLFQGDGTIAPYCIFPNPAIKDIPVLLLSNTCDMDISNQRVNTCRIMYTPILKIDKYIESLKKREIPEERINNHIRDLKEQTISQAMYLPSSHILGYDGVVFFDRVISIQLTEDIVKNFVRDRKIVLSNYGFYLLLLKLSYHFTRIQEKVDRSA